MDVDLKQTADRLGFERGALPIVRPGTRSSVPQQRRRGGGVATRGDDAGGLGSDPPRGTAPQPADRRLLSDVSAVPKERSGRPLGDPLHDQEGIARCVSMTSYARS